MVTRVLLVVSTSLRFLISSAYSLYVAHDSGARRSSRDNGEIEIDFPFASCRRWRTATTPDEPGIENERSEEEVAAACSMMEKKMRRREDAGTSGMMKSSFILYIVCMKFLDLGSHRYCATGRIRHESPRKLTFFMDTDGNGPQKPRYIRAQRRGLHRVKPAPHRAAPRASFGNVSRPSFSAARRIDQEARRIFLPRALLFSPTHVSLCHTVTLSYPDILL